MAANDYTRTVNITPLGTTYAWDTPPSWITITRVGSSNDWTITVSANGGSARSATLTVRHDNGSTTDTITVSQAGTSSGGGAGPTATPVPDPTATPNPTPTSAAGAGPTPVPNSGAGAGPTPTPTRIVINSGVGAGPTATPVPNPTATGFVSGGGPGGGGCHVAGEMITMANGEIKAIENIQVGDQLLSFDIHGYNYDHELYQNWSSHIDNFSGEFTSVQVNHVIVDTYTSYYNFNEGALKVTYEHPILIKDINGMVSWKIARDASVGESMLNENNQWVSINTKSYVETGTPFSTWTLDVENEDVYFANGILVHNYENELVKNPGDNFGENTGDNIIR
jgi:hypothetical protein